VRNSGWANSGLVQITEDFLAAYQANYGFTKDGQHDPNAACAPDTDTTAKPEEGKKAEKRTDTEQLKDGKKEKGEKRKADTAGTGCFTDMCLA
jgi:HIV Tat-specific factor 1